MRQKQPRTRIGWAKRESALMKETLVWIIPNYLLLGMCRAQEPSGLEVSSTAGPLGVVLRRSCS